MVLESNIKGSGVQSETSKRLLFRIRVLLFVFIAGLVISGATAIPLQSELELLCKILGVDGNAGTGLGGWLLKVRNALVDTNLQYPFLAYGTDWLAFGHFVIAIAFIGPWRDPARNVWVIEFGMIACVLIVPYALAMGEVRGIPFGWRLIDCSFGLFGILPLWWCRRMIKRYQEICESAT